MVDKEPIQTGWNIYKNKYGWTDNPENMIRTKLQYTQILNLIKLGFPHNEVQGQTE